MQFLLDNCALMPIVEEELHSTACGRNRNPEDKKGFVISSEARNLYVLVTS